MERRSNRYLLKRFVKYYKPHKGLLFLDLVCALLLSAIDLAFPMISKTALNDFLPKSDFRSFFVIVLVLLVLFVLRTFFQFVIDYWGHILGVRIEYDLRKELFDHLQSLSFKFYDKTRTGHIMSRMVNDLNEITEMAHHGPEDLFISVIMFIGSFVAMLMMKWELALAIYVLIPFILLFAIKSRKRMNLGFRQVKKSLADVNAELESSISGIRVSKAFTNEVHEINKFNKNNTTFKHSKDDAYRYMSIFSSGITFMTNLMYVVALGLGGYFIYLGEMTIIELLAFTLYINAFLVPIKRISAFTQQFEMGITGFERFTELMEIEPLIKNSLGAKDLGEIKGEIKFDSVAFAYNDKEKVLHDISLSVEPGKTLALVGPSGGGKTTLCHLIPRFYDIDEGVISIDGVDIRDITVENLRGHIGLVSQDVFLFASTIRDNIMYGNVASSEEEMIDAAKKAEIHDYIMTLPDGYDTLVGERGLRLSGGQKQRISIARVFLKNPAILILDEATSALDNATEVKIQKALTALSKGRTSLVIAHRLSTIKNADEIVVITEEGIKEQGNHEALLEESGIYASLYKAQFKGYIPDEVV